MADLTYLVEIDTRGAQRSLNSLRSSIGGIGAALGVAFSARQLVQISSRFQDLRTTLNFLFKDAAQGSKAFDQIKTFAQQSVFSVEDLTNSVVKLKAAGLDPTINQLRLFADVSSVATDSVGALQAITDLFARTTEGGLGLEDLNRLADRGIPVFKILGERLGLSRLEISKFGQTAEGAQVILKALTAGLQEAFGGASAARANNLSQAMSNLEDAFANLADTIGQGGFNKALTDAINSLSAFIERNQKVIEAIGAGLGGAITFAVDNLKLLAIAFTAAVSIKGITALYTGIKALREMAAASKNAAIAFAVLQGVTGVGLIKLAAGMAAVAGVIEGIDAYTNDAKESVVDLQAEIDKLQKTPGPQIPDGPLTAPNAGVDTSTYKVEFEKIKKQQDDIAKSSIDYFRQYRDSVNDVKTKIKQQSELVKLTESEANVQRELNDFTKRYFDTIRPLQQEVTELKIKDTEESKLQAAEIERQIGLITNLYKTSIAGLKTELELREKNRQDEETRILLLNNLRDLQEDLNDSIRQSNRDLEDLNLTPFQKEIKDITREIDDKLIKSINNIKRQWENGLITNDAYLAEIKNLEAEANKAFETLTENAKKQRQIQRSFEYGWRQAFENYKDDATNAAKAAERIFDKATSSMEDMIVNFAKTGKFEFKSFVNSILEDMLRANVRQLFTQTLSGGGIVKGLGKLLGFANGGIIPTNGPVLVGERGPEIISGAFGRNVTPNEQLGFGTTSVIYNINAVDALSFKQLVASDPGFIYAVTEQGRKTIPSGRR